MTKRDAVLCILAAAVLLAMGVGAVIGFIEICNIGR
jgi:hypothetical protein